MAKTFKTRIALRRADENVLASKNPQLLNGEIVLVNTSSGIKTKIGDGNKTFNELPYEEFLIRGYYLNGKFYTDSTYIVEIIPSIDHLYLDINAERITKKCLYFWDGTKYIATNGEDIATDTVAGIMKLYDGLGDNIDGSITQRAATEAAQNGVVDEDDECLILTHIQIDNNWVENH